MLPSASSVTRFSGRGRSSVESQKSIACLATRSSVHSGASLVSVGFSRDGDVLDGRVIWAAEHLDDHGLSRKRLESQRTHELGRVASHDDADLNAAPLQPSQNFGGFVSADAACDA